MVLPDDFSVAFPHKDPMPSPPEMNALAGALGSVIGYLGTEAADTALFEALLWPERCYSKQTPLGCLLSAIL